MSQESIIIENSKILRSIWKNTFDKILEIKEKYGDASVKLKAYEENLLS